MGKYYVIKVDQINYELFKEFSKDHSQLMWEFKSDYFTGSELVHDFIVTIGPTILTALSSYIIAKIPKENEYIKFKNGEKEVELKVKTITHEDVARILDFLKEDDSDSEE